MNWNGVELKYREDWAEAIGSLRDSYEAALFFQRCHEEFGPETEAVVGYLTNELKPPMNRHARALLGVVNPLNPEDKPMTAMDWFRNGLAMGESGSTPMWLLRIMAIPRRNWNPNFPADE